MSTEYRDLLSAIRDALDLPRPANEAERQDFERLQSSRVISVLGSLDAVLSVCPPEVVAQVLRDHVRDLPVTYRPEAQDSPAEVTR